MDSKHRHELEQNELAKWIIHQYEDWIKPNSNWLGYAVLGILVIAVVIFVTASLNKSNQNAAWKQYYAALNSENPGVELEFVANSTSGLVGVQARLALAQHQLGEGTLEATAETFVDKSKAIALLEKAIDSFQQVQKATSDSTVLSQAGFGLGQCRETLAAVRMGDDLTKAEEEYKKIIEQWKDSAMSPLAQKRLALIQQPGTKMFLERLAMKTPVVSSSMEGFGGFSVDRDDPLFPGGFGGGFDPEMMLDVKPPIEAPTLNTETTNLETEQSAENTEPESSVPTVESEIEPAT